MLSPAIFSNCAPELVSHAWLWLRKLGSARIRSTISSMPVSTPASEPSIKSQTLWASLPISFSPGGIRLIPRPRRSSNFCSRLCKSHFRLSPLPYPRIAFAMLLAQNSLNHAAYPSLRS